MVGAFLLRTPPPTLPCMGGRVRGRERMQEEGRGGPTPASPRVALGSAPLTRHRSTFGASSEGLVRPAGREEEEGRGWVNRRRFLGGEG